MSQDHGLAADCKGCPCLLRVQLADIRVRGPSTSFLRQTQTSLHRLFEGEVAHDTSQSHNVSRSGSTHISAADEAWTTLRHDRIGQIG